MSQKTTAKMPFPAGTRLRFVRDNLGASRKDDLCCTTGAKYGLGDTGVAAFPHPNWSAAERGWFYVEVTNKSKDERDDPKLYVGVTPDMVEDI